MASIPTCAYPSPQKSAIFSLDMTPSSLAITYEDIVTSICASICAREVVHSQLVLALAFVLDSTLPIIVIQFCVIYTYKFFVLIFKK